MIGVTEAIFLDEESGRMRLVSIPYQRTAPDEPIAVLIYDSDDKPPERQEHESWYHYHLRWWFYWSTQAGEKKREGYRSAPWKGSGE